MVDVRQSSQHRLRPCRNNRCCGNHLFFAENEAGERELIPLKSVKVHTELQGPLAVMSVELTYTNPHQDSPLECTYTFPLDKATVLTSFEAVIADRTVKTKVTDKEEAKQRYEDAIASGNATVFAERQANQTQ